MSYILSYTKKCIKKYSLLLAVMAAVNLSVLGQEKEDKYKDYKSAKTIGLSGGLIGIGMGGEIRADIAFDRFVLTGTAGFKASGVQDSNYTYFSKTYKRIVYSDSRGPIYKLGAGIRLKRWETASREFVAENLVSVSKTYDATYYTYSGHYSDLPVLITRYLIFEISSQPTGIFTQMPTSPRTKKNVLVPGSNTYFTAIIRRLQQYKYVNRQWIFDLGFVAGSQLDQTGAYINSSLINNFVNFSLTLGAVRRFDKPADFEDPFNGDGMYKWIFPFQATFGFTFHLPK